MRVNGFHSMSKRHCCRVAQFDFIVLAALGLLIVSVIHWVLLNVEGGWCVRDCYFAINNKVDWGYKFALLHGPLLLNVLALVWMQCLRVTSSEERVRYAVGGFLLIGIAVGYVSAYHWVGLGGLEDPSATIRNIALAVTAMLGSIFIVWQSRIAGKQARATARQVRAIEKQAVAAERQARARERRALAAERQARATERQTRRGNR